jgi:two-component system, sensor histidine kinase and response regulator
MDEISILVIDDEEGIRESIKRALRNFKMSLSYIESDYAFTVDVAETAEIGLEMMKTKQYDILLLDNQLPGMHGVDLLKLLHESQRDILTIMITAFASIETAITATKNGAYDFLTKPFTPQELKDAILKASKHFILTNSAKKLEAEKKKIRFEFISVLSHELKSPIAAISNYLKLMEKRIAGNDIAAYDEFIKRSEIRIKDMEKLIFDLLDLTRIESGEKKRVLSPVRIDTIVNESLSNFKEEIQKRSLNVESELSEIEFNSDKTEIEIIVNNFISNAIKYNVDNGKIKVFLGTDNGSLKFSVADTGIGIEPKDQEKLFKEFSRIKNEKTANISGSGIGLSTVKKIISLYNGSVDVKSEYGKGSVFTVILRQQA